MNAPLAYCRPQARSPSRPRMETTSFALSGEAPSSLPLVVFSHLRWDFVYQRPQHVLSRLAARRRVLFVEEPAHGEGEPRWEKRRVLPNLTVCRPMTPSEAPGYAAEQLPYLADLMERLQNEEGVVRCVAWFYTPMAYPLLATLGAEAVVYDCMDELSLFKFAPPDLLAHERALLARADLVLTGGPSLYRAKRDLHPNVHCFPSSVEVEHFAQARHGGPALGEPPSQAPIPRPRLGYFGVIDERMDLPLIAAVADARPDWQLVFVGPVVKIDAGALPRRPNLHYLGGQPYERLPAFLAGWDVGLLPFALNDHTRFISPTKTLEYMAAEVPIVSTPITDVAEPYGDIVYLGDTPEAFVAACERAMTASPAERAARTAGMRRVLAQTSWDATAAAMELCLETALVRARSAVLTV